VRCSISDKNPHPHPLPCPLPDDAEDVLDSIDDAITADDVARQLSSGCSSAHAGSCLSAANASLAALPFF
jgi:hypothetical protein